MKNTLRFHDGSIQLSSDALLGYLRQCGAQTLHQVISQLCPEYLQFSGTKRILLWSSVRNFLEKMERAGLITRMQSEPHAVWKASDTNNILLSLIHI